jgi:hypothetical protein
MFSKPVKPQEEYIKWELQREDAKMPLPRSVAGSGDSRKQTFRRSGISFQGPDEKQNAIIENLQAKLIQLAYCDCCSKAKYNPRTKFCEGQNCLHAAFLDKSTGEFDYLEAKKCYMHYHDLYSNLSAEKWKIWCYDQFGRCSYGLDDNGDIIHGFHFKYGPLENTTTHKVCRKVWAAFMGDNCTKHRMDVFARAYKSEYSPIGSTFTLRSNYSDTTMHDTNLKEINELFVEAGIGIDDPDSKKMGLVRRTEMETFLWFRDHMDLSGDPQPNLQQIHLDKIEKTEMYEIYVNEVGRSQALCFSSWRTFWDKVFPEVVIRQWKSVSGKCEHCASINAGRRAAKSAMEIAAFRKLHILHKSGHFMLERLSYHKRRAESENDDTIFSGIIDIMDNNHCQCPYEANKNSFSNAIHQGICGFLRHGQEKGFTIYRTTGKLQT